MRKEAAAELIARGQAVLGIEFGSTREWCSARPEATACCSLLKAREKKA